MKTESEAAYAGVESALQNAAAAQARDQGDIMEAERQLWEKSRRTCHFVRAPSVPILVFPRPGSCLRCEECAPEVSGSVQMCVAPSWKYRYPQVSHTLQK